MGIILSKTCVLVTTAFVLTLVPGFRRSERSLLSLRDRGTALLVFMILGLVEQTVVGQTGWFNHRIVVVCAAGLLAGPSVGVAVACFVTWMAVAWAGRPPGPVFISMLCGGLGGGWLYRWRPKLAQQPLTGLCLTATVSCLRDGLTFLCVPQALAGEQISRQMGMAPVLQGLGTALILAIVALVRDRDEQTQAANAAEVRSLHSRMNPHFLFNTLNTVAALARIAPGKIPCATGRIRHFLRANFDQHEQALVPLAEELEVVRTYLDIESLRYGDRLKLEEAVDPSLLEALIPPFSLQPLVENAVQHGLRSSPKAGCLHLRVRRRIGDWLDMSVRDDGPGVAATEVERVFFALGSGVHALSLLRRRLQGLFGRSFWLEVCSDVGQGTTVTLRIPLQTQSDVRTQSSSTVAS
jgi:LytS/YehU family sensor histidine kinase